MPPCAKQAKAGNILQTSSSVCSEGTLKMREMKIRGMKMRHHTAWHENTRHENAAPKIRGENRKSET